MPLRCKKCGGCHTAQTPCRTVTVKAKRRGAATQDSRSSTGYAAGRKWQHALSLIDEAIRNFEHGQPPKGCYTADLVKRMKRFCKRHNVPISHAVKDSHGS